MKPWIIGFIILGAILAGVVVAFQADPLWMALLSIVPAAKRLVAGAQATAARDQATKDRTEAQQQRDTVRDALKTIDESTDAKVKDSDAKWDKVAANPTEADQKEMLDRFKIVPLVFLALWIGSAQADPPKALTFATPLERAYWQALVQCRKELESDQIQLDGERDKVATTTTTVFLSCPEIPACPACPACGGCWTEGALGAVGGALASGLICSLGR